MWVKGTIKTLGIVELPDHKKGKETNQDLGRKWQTGPETGSGMFFCPPSSATKLTLKPLCKRNGIRTRVHARLELCSRTNWQALLYSSEHTIKHLTH
jgi:hypothetical protein